MKKMTISIGIPAYNEEKNVAFLLKSIFDQERADLIKEVIIVSDGSTDNTVSDVKNFKEKRIRLVDDNVRKGKSERLNQIFRLFKGDILVLVDADCVLDKSALNEIYKNFRTYTDLSLLGCNATSYPPKSFIQKGIKVSTDVVENISKGWRNGDNVYAFNGRLIALSSFFAKNIKLPKVLGDDMYLYLYARKLGLRRLYASKARVYSVLPKTLDDHLKQSLRFVKARKQCTAIFGTWVDQEFNISRKPLLVYFLKETFRNPFYMLCYLVILVWARIKSKFLLVNKDENIWQMSLTSRTYN